MTEPCLLVLMVPARLEYTLTDWLLASHGEVGFTCLPAFGHGDQPDTLSLQERIAGRSRVAQFQIVLKTREAAKAMVDSLGAQFPNLRLRWWISPLLESGHSG